MNEKNSGIIGITALLLSLSAAQGLSCSTNLLSQHQQCQVNYNAITPETYRQVIEATVKVDYVVSTGSGIAISKDYILTNSHVFDQRLTEELIAITNKTNGYIGTATILKREQETDLALLKLSQEYPLTFEQNIASSYSLGCITIGGGYPFGQDEIILLTGIISGLDSDKEGVVLINDHSNKGQSGGGIYLINDPGELSLVGIITYSYSNMNKTGFISSDKIAEFLKGTPLEEM